MTILQNFIIFILLLLVLFFVFILSATADGVDNQELAYQNMILTDCLPPKRIYYWQDPHTLRRIDINDAIIATPSTLQFLLASFILYLLSKLPLLTSIKKARSGINHYLAYLKHSLASTFKP